ncbi:oligopeptide ABC transporter permease [Brockia lithotrophica]|uniref:Peptide/nickel transport system permease protein n=1 Tax=Brockia lithotrophica TaxID=933949 RepID=A0A660L5C6_9BACL|nr:oligopeptide ABC transporter permease [Brockia lithotrophica]RKQ89116.1 peptide/nickel transport system permease protein [Brockia lithotrophica]
MDGRGEETRVGGHPPSKGRRRHRSQWGDVFARLIRNPRAIVGISLLVFMFLFAFVGPLLSPYAGAKADVSQGNRPPSAEHWLGTDNLGRDVLLRLMEGGRISLTVGIIATAILVAIGTTVGLLAGFYGGWTDTLLMRLVDILFALPALPLFITVGAVLSDLKFPPEKRIFVLMLLIGGLSWMGLARLVRSQVLSLREQEFMLATEVLGLSDRRKLLHHLLPNVAATIIVSGTLAVAGAIVVESALSFLGLGVIPPTPSWGQMLSAANNLIDFKKRPWLWIPPGVAILVTVLAINILGDALRDTLDPRTQRRVR